jgi:5-(carboxyamino)imidazole ribonucleotide synthase
MAVHVGIYGGGQLGLYLCRAARRLGLETTVVSPEPDCPAASAADHLLTGAFDDLELAARLVDRVDVVTFELEAIPQATLGFLAAAEARNEVEVAPGAATLGLLQDKARQKAWMVEQGLPTAAFETHDGPVDGRGVAGRLGLPFVQKLQRGGYDGRGVQVIRTERDLASLWPEPSLCETFLPDVAELAVLVARGRDGALCSYAPVGLFFDPEHNILETVVAPARVAPEVAQRAEEIARRAIELLEGVGVFAVEMFLRPDGELLINEISPRVHNAGHHTMEACRTSQFEQHLRAITGMPLGDVEQLEPAVMRNLLWSPQLERFRDMPVFVETGGGPDVALHWYGKRDPKPWRKMGHITCLGHEAEAALWRTEMLYKVLANPVHQQAA